nr:MAG TPA: PolyVal ADP-Ribosyltransferase [Caudoviricetes sp.]
MGAWSEYKKQQEQERRTGKWTEYKQSGSYRKSGAAAAPAASGGRPSQSAARTALPEGEPSAARGTYSPTRSRYKAQGGVTFEQYKAAVDSITQQRYRAMRGMTEGKPAYSLDTPTMGALGRYRQDTTPKEEAPAIDYGDHGSDAAMEKWQGHWADDLFKKVLAQTPTDTEGIAKRGEMLSRMQWGEDEKKAAKALLKAAQVQSLTGNAYNPSDYAPAWDAYMRGDNEEYTRQVAIYDQLYARLHPKSTAFRSAAVESTGLLSMAKLGAAAAGDETGIKTLQSSEQAGKQAQAAEPGITWATKVGIGAGMALLPQSMLNPAAGALAKTALGATKLGQAAISAGQTALSFAAREAIQNAGGLATGEMTGGQFAQRTLASAAGGAAGSIASGLVSSGVAKLLTDKQMMTPFKEYLRQTAASATFSAANTGVSAVASGRKMTKEEIATELGMSFAFAMVDGYLSAMRSTKAASEQVKAKYDQITQEFDAIQNHMNGRQYATQEEYEQALRDLRTHVKELKAEVGSTYYAGQQEFVNDIQKGLDVAIGNINIMLAGDTGTAAAAAGTSGVGAQTVRLLTSEIEDAFRTGASDTPNTPVTGGAPESTALNDNPTQHTPAEQQVIEAYKSSADKGLVEFYQRAKTNQSAGRYTLQTVTERAADDIRNLTGQDVDGFKTTLDARQAWHINNDHGANGKADHSMENDEDVARMQYVLNNYDSAEYGGTTDAYWESKKNGKSRRSPVVVFSKKVNGTYYIVEATPVTKAKSVYVVSAYMLGEGKTPPGRGGQNKKGANPQPPDANAPWLTSENDSAEITPERSVAQNAQTVKRDEWLPENMDVEDDIPSNMDVIDEDGDGLPDNMELEGEPSQSPAATALPEGEPRGGGNARQVGTENSGRTEASAPTGAQETVGANGEPEVRTVLRQAGQEDVRGRVKGDKLLGKVGDTLRQYKARLKQYDARTAELRGLEANAQQVRNNEPSPHQSPTATASPRGEAINARVQELREQIAQDEAYLTARERDMQDVANVARARLENERQQKELGRETQTLSDKELRETEQSAQAQESAAELAARRAAEEQDAAELERIAKQREYGFAMTQYFISGYFDANDRVQMDIPTYAEAVRVAYGKGRFGWKFKREDLQRGIADEVLQEAYKEGRRKGEENGTAGIGNGGERDAGMDSDEPSGRVGRGAGGAEKESAGGFGVKESLRIQSVLGTAKAERLSPKADGIENGSEQKMLYRVPEEMVQEYPALKQAKQILTDAGADDVRLVSGSIRIRTAGGREMSVQGVTQGTTVWLTIDAKDGVLKTAEHEAMHLRLEAEPGLRERLIDALGLSQEQRDKLARKYCEAYEGCYTGEDMSAYLDEIVCDAYAGINRMGLGADKLQNAVRTAADSTASQRTKKPAQTRGPPVKLSKDTSTREQTQREITERYQNEVHEILENGKRSTGALVVGYTPELYRKLGMPELPFVIGGGHVYSIAKTRAEAEAEGRAYKNVNYHGLGENTVANILELVKKPVMVIASKDVDKGTTPLRSTHSVVALVDVGKNGKSLVIPVSITAESTVDGTVMNVNMLSSAYERNVSGLVNEAVAQFNAGENSVFYVQREAATLLGEGVQFPSILEAAAASNDIVRRFDEKINMSVKNVTQSQQFKRWFGDWQNQPEKASKVVNADGTPKVVYHQTDGEFTVFDTRKQGAGTRDSETPFGIFMKSSDRDIGLRGKKQMALYANIRNPLIAQNRADLKQQLRTMSADYAALTQQHEELDQEYRKKFQNANENFKAYILDWRKKHPGTDSRELYGTAEFERLFNEEDRVSEEWTEKADELSLQEKNALTDALRSAGYDGVHLLNDAGSFGRSTDAWIALNPNQVKSAADNVGTFGKNNPDIRFSPETRDANAEANVAEEQDRGGSDPLRRSAPPPLGHQGEASETGEKPKVYSYDKLPGKARAFVDQAVNSAVRQAANAMSIPGKAKREVLKPAIQGMMNEFLKTGRIAPETINKSFEDAYDAGIEEDREFYDTFKHIKVKLLKTGVRVTPEVRAEFADLEQFRRAVRGKILLNNEGIGIDTLYGELHDEAPGLFPEAIMNPADQLMRMIEVADKIQITKQTLDEAHKGDGGDYKRWARNDFEAAVEDMKASLRTARAWAESRERTKLAQEAPKSQAEVEELYKRQREARRAYERVQSRNLLTDEDERILDRLLRGELAPEDIQDRENARSILNVYEAKADYAALTAQIARWRRGVKEGYREQVRPLLENTEQAKDKKGLAPGFRYDRETAERNIEDVFPAADAKRINETIFEPVHTQQAKSTRFKNDYRARVRKMNLSRKVKAGDVVSEAHAVQLYGEAMDNIRQLTKRPMDAKRDGKTLAEWEAVVRELWEKNPGIRKEKVERAVGEFRKIYDELFTQMNDVRVRNGYEPIDYRKGYFPHFRPGQTDGVLAVMGKALGIKADVTALPTTINGLTHTFKPGITWFGNAQERLGFNTAYDAVEGFDKYIEGAADIVFQTDNIQRLRAFASEVRYRTSNEGVRERVDAIRADESISEQDKELRIKDLYENAKFELSGFAAWLDEYTNLLANKKSKLDRGVESVLGRGFYNAMNWLESRAAANMVAMNPGSWLTNFIPLTQAWGYVSTGDMVQAMGQTIAAMKNDDGFWERSAFLTNRRGSDPLVRTWQGNLSAKLSMPMEWIDTFTADTIVRARYNQNLRRGMLEEDAMREADRFAANIMADRSKGATPTMFQSRNPFVKLFTQFQLEVNNQFSNIFKDLPREMRKRGLQALAWALFKMFFSAWAYNELYEKVVGRRAALDPIDMTNELVGDATGYKLNNVLDVAFGSEAGFIHEGKPAGFGNTVTNFLTSTAEELPMVGGVLGGGRVPFSSALPDVSAIWKVATNKELDSETKNAKLWEEVRDPLLYLGLPFGGGQIRKVAQGIYAVAKGGKFYRNNKGELQMQYPVFTDEGAMTVMRDVQAGVFGRNATKEARDWVQGGFSKLSTKETNAYLAMSAADVKQREAWKLIQAMKDVDVPEGASEREAKLAVLNAYDIADEAKALYYYNVIASEKEQAMLQRLLNENADVGAYLEYRQALPGADGWKDAEGNTVSGSKKSELYDLLDSYDFTPEQKDAIAGESYKLTGFEPWTEQGKSLREAAMTGKNVTQVVRELKKAGYTNGEISQAITALCRQDFREASERERIDLRAHLATVYAMLGKDRKKALEKIDEWAQ